MSETKEGKRNWKKRLGHELFEYWLTVVYLSFVFGAFTWYKRLILAGYKITYLNYGVAIIEALVLAKVILIGDMLRLGRRFEDRPLIIPTLNRSVIFMIWVGVFRVIEQTIGGLIRGQGWMGAVKYFSGIGKYEFLGNCLVIFFTFIPFFAFKELNLILGEGKVWKLFFRSREAA